MGSVVAAQRATRELKTVILSDESARVTQVKRSKSYCSGLRLDVLATEPGAGGRGRARRQGQEAGAGGRGLEQTAGLRFAGLRFAISHICHFSYLPFLICDCSITADGKQPKMDGR
jgi:hypothetical protein